MSGPFGAITAPSSAMTGPMRLYLDTADASELERVLPSPLVHGVTTNPTLMRRAGLSWADLPHFVERAEALGARSVHVQVRHREATEMLRDAREFLGLAAKATIVVKLPATGEGLSAAATLAQEGVSVTMTAVYEPEQALWAALVGARYAAPYLGRLQDAGRDALAVIARMQQVLEVYGRRDGTDLRLLVASVRSREAFRDLLALGVGAVTVPVKLFDELTATDETLAAEEAFLADAR